MKPDVIIAFAFGAPDKIISNEIIAFYAICAAYYGMIPIVAQKDVYVSLMESPAISKIKIFHIKTEERHISTFGLIQKFVRLAEKYGWKKVEVVAAPMHKNRCQRDLGKAGFEVIDSQPIPKEIKRSSFWFHEESSQWWTRSAIRWWLREIPIRLVPFWVYKRFFA